MEAIKLEATLETRLSKKSGNEYTVLVVKLSPTYEKTIFLENSELELIRVLYSKSQK